MAFFVNLLHIYNLSTLIDVTPFPITMMRSSLYSQCGKNGSFIRLLPSPPTHIPFSHSPSVCTLKYHCKYYKVNTLYFYIFPYSVLFLYFCLILYILKSKLANSCERYNLSVICNPLYILHFITPVYDYIINKLQNTKARERRMC